MSLLSSPLIALLSRAIALTGQRQVLVSENVANVDTPGYRTRDINFQQELRQAIAAPEESVPLPMSQEVVGLIERPDGNNVSVDRESLLMAENQLQYQTEVTLLRSEFNRLQSAISGGGGGQ